MYSSLVDMAVPSLSSSARRRLLLGGGETFLHLLAEETHEQSQYPKFLFDCLVLSVCSAAGQLFIYFTIAQFGAVVFVIIMTIRQGLAILLSCIIYHHHITSVGIIGIFLVFVSIFLRIYCSHRLKAIKHRNQMSAGSKV